jgi:hypothetical protein
MDDNRPELGLDCFGRLVVEIAKGRMRSIVDMGEPIAWCGCLLLVLSVAETIWSLGPSFF